MTLPDTADHRNVGRPRPVGNLLQPRFRRLGKIAILDAMPSEARPVCARASVSPEEATPKRALAAGDGWSLHEIVCRAGPSDRPFEERHNGFSVAAVLEGSFTYRSNAGHGLLYPGALLLGNNGACFECGHAHGVGDRCVSLNVHEEEFSEVAATMGSSSRFRFSAPSLPPSPKTLPVIAHMEALSSAPSSPRSEERALQIIERVIAATTGDREPPAAPTGRETKRVIDAIRLVESDAARPLELKEMAAAAGMSKYHFLRVFRRLTGLTPHRYLISARLRRAAVALASSRRPVIAIALDAGFGDLSTFNKTFRAVFGVTPTQYRGSRR
jgi:AraC family transcriptional regulator